MHLGAFWLLADKHFLPKALQVPRRPPANFAAGERTLAVDPVTGEKVTRRDFVVSTRLEASWSKGKGK